MGRSSDGTELPINGPGAILRSLSRLGTSSSKQSYARRWPEDGHWSLGSGFHFLVDKMETFHFLVDKMETGVFQRNYFTVPADGKIADIERCVLERRL